MQEAHILDSTLDAYRNQNNLLIIFAPSESDAQYQEQEELLANQERTFAAQDLLIFRLFADGDSTVAGTQSPSALPQEAREKFAIDEEDFTLLLLGKDGRVRLQSEQPIAAQKLLAVLNEKSLGASAR